jgi:hypothetical protein
MKLDSLSLEKIKNILKENDFNFDLMDIAEGILPENISLISKSEDVQFETIEIEIPDFVYYKGDSYINGELGKVNKTYLKNEKTGDYWLINEEVIKLPIPAQSISCKNKEAVDFNQSLYKDMDIEESFEAIQSGILTVSVPDTVSNQQKQFDGEVGVIKKTIAVNKETGDKTVLIKEVIKLPTPGFSVVTDGLFENNNIIIKNKNLSLLIFRD